MHTDKDRLVHEVEVLGAQSLESDPKPVRADDRIGPVNPCPSVFIRGFLLHSYG